MVKALYIQAPSLMEVVHTKNRMVFESCLEKDTTYFSFNQIEKSDCTKALAT